MPTVAVFPQPIELLPNEGPKPIGDDFSLDDVIAGGDSLTGTPTVTITLNGVAHGTELVVGPPSINGKTVAFNCQTVGAVVGSVYKCDIRCPTLGGSGVQAVRDLVIIGRG